MGSAADDAGCLEERIGYRFRDPALLEAALLHSSALPAGPVRSSEQLEFLGDAVLDLAVAELLLRAFPDADEGRLSKWRAVLVRTSTLAAKARELRIGEALFLGRGEERSGGRDKDSILAAAYEAVLGAVFRDGGFLRALDVVAGHFAAELSAESLNDARDWKTTLQESTQARFRCVPGYRLVEERGPAHAREFECEVWVADHCLARGAGTSKREAEQRAAQLAIDRLDELTGLSADDDGGE